MHRFAIVFGAAAGVLLIASAPTMYSRLTAIFVVVALAGIAGIAYRTVRARLWVLDCRVDECMERMAGLAERVRANPPTTAEGQRVVDEIRSIWGDEADRWFGKAPLN